MCFSKQLTKHVFHFENKKKLFLSFSLENKKTKTITKHSLKFPAKNSHEKSIEKPQKKPIEKTREKS